MAKEVRLPQLGQTMEEGTIVNVMIKEGDEVKKGDVLFEVETDKATLEMESPAEGTVKKILVQSGETYPINTPVAILGDKDEQVDQSFIDSLTGGQSAETSGGGEAAAQTSSAPSGGEGLPDSAKVINLPQLGQTMEEGTIVSCLVKVGDEIKKGDVLFEVETDKATLEMESPAEGFLKAVLVDDGEVVPVNEAIAVLADKDAEISQDYVNSLKGGGQAKPTAQPQEPAPATPAASAPAKTGGRVFASPRAKMTAQQLDIDISTVSPAAGAMRIVEADVRRAAASGTATAAGKGAGLSEMPAPAHKLGERVKISRMQKIVGERMLKSKLEIPCFYLNVVVDATDMVALRAKVNKQGDVKVSFNDFIIRAVGMGLKHYPIMTGQLDGDHVQIAKTIDVGLAIAVDDGLVAPLSKDADMRNVREIAQYNKELISRAKSNKLGTDDLSGGCITVSNLGGFGIDSFIPIVVPGQCSIMGVGKITDTCVPSDGNILVRKMMNINLSVDHKVANGADAAQFLDFVKKLLENPESLL